MVCYDDTEQVSELELLLNEMKSRLEIQEEEATSVIEKWQTRCTSQEERCAKLEKQVSETKTEQETTVDSQVVPEVATADEAFGRRQEEVDNSSRQLIEQLEAQLQDKEDALQEAKDALASEGMALYWKGRNKTLVWYFCIGVLT